MESNKRVLNFPFCVLLYNNRATLRSHVACVHKDDHSSNWIIDIARADCTASLIHRPLETELYYGHTISRDSVSNDLFTIYNSYLLKKLLLFHYISIVHNLLYYHLWSSALPRPTLFMKPTTTKIIIERNACIGSDNCDSLCFLITVNLFTDTVFFITRLNCMNNIGDGPSFNCPDLVLLQRLQIRLVATIVRFCWWRVWSSVVVVSTVTFHFNSQTTRQVSSHIIGLGGVRYTNYM